MPEVSLILEFAPPRRSVTSAGGFGAPLNHLIGVLGQGIAGEPAGRAAVGLEQDRLGLPSSRSALVF
jgi:hypothetical protein